MNRCIQLSAAVCLLAVGCSPGADVNGFPSATANAYCQMAYKCCTPVERACFPGSNACSTSSNGSFATLALFLDFSNQGECDQKLGDELQNVFQAYQASAKDKRLSWNASAAQACLTALDTAASKCDATAFVQALSGDPQQPQNKAVCDVAALMVTGNVASGGACMISADCSGTGSTCTPPKPVAGQPTTVQAGGTCTALPTATQACNTPGPTGCESGNSCCNGFTNAVCVAYVAEGSPCSPPNSFACSSQPCDPTKDYCGSTGGTPPAADTCLPLIAGGLACGKDQNNQTVLNSCLTGTCNSAGSCPAAGGNAVNYSNICTGNKDGI